MEVSFEIRAITYLNHVMKWSGSGGEGRWVFGHGGSFRRILVVKVSYKIIRLAYLKKYCTDSESSSKIESIYTNPLVKRMCGWWVWMDGSGGEWQRHRVVFFVFVYLWRAARAAPDFHFFRKK